MEKTFGAEGIESPSPSGFRNALAAPPVNDSAIAFVQSQLGLNATQVGYRSGFTGGANQRYAYVKQYHDGVPFSNAVANIAWKSGRVVAFGSSFVNTTNIAPSTPTLTVDSVIPDVEQTLEGTRNDHPTTLEYLVREDGSVSLTHVIQVRNQTTGTWYEAFVCAHSGKVLSVTDFVAHATYHVLPIHKQTFPEGQETLVDPEDTLASPFGWHGDSTEKFTSTFGNNAAVAKANFGNGDIPKDTFLVNGALFVNQTSAGPTFDVKYDDSLDPTVGSNVAAAVVNAFYITNVVHDFAYRYGFTEDAFNFQADNFENGGKGGDPVKVSVQDSRGLNNANFATPPDGQSGQCNMFIWDQTDPRRDGSLENDILVHELTHGITSRMTGGGTARCMGTTEAGGLGEGWSDAMAEWVSQKSGKVEDFVMGQYVIGSTKGIRSHPYSTDPYVDAIIGEIWANMLHNVYAALVAERGFSSEALANPDTMEGNVVFMHLFLDALLLQPCNPTFVAARDAWIQADENRYNGANKCTLYNSFASRGLGLNADGGFVDNTDVPAGC
ncbi:hypothetical protein H0H87_007011 [Tephrocybe sp. NHM501043]|nr:hypothetical protein H0H87_007011 [Tephrocybe sp. NHM501043]